MAELKYSALLEKIMDKAAQLARENACSGVTRDFIAAAMAIIVNDLSADSLEGTEKEELSRLSEILKENTYTVAPLLEAWNGKDVTSTERLIVFTQKSRAIAMAQEAQLDCVPADILLKIMLTEKSSAMKSAMHTPEPPEQKPAANIADLLKSKKRPAAPAAKPVEAEPETPPEKPVEVKPLTMLELAEQTKRLQKALQQSVLGQDHAVSTFVSGYFQAELQAMIEKDRVRPRATYLFAGPPGVGKTFLSEQAAQVLGLPFRRFDMSEYANPNAPDELSGSDANYKGSSEGQLTGFVAQKPHCVLLFDEIEKASLDVIHLFLQVLDAGRLRDNKTDEEVSFRDAILIFTTNAGKNLYEDSTGPNLSGLSREVILDALSHDINPKTREPFFPPAICSRFGSGNVVMFNHLQAHTLRRIVEKQLVRHFDDLNETMELTAEMDASVPSAILFAEGASADARTVKSRADAFFGTELFELFRLATSKRVHTDPQALRRIRFEIDLTGSSPDIAALFTPDKRLHAIVRTDTPLSLDEDLAARLQLHYADSFDQAKQLLKTQPIQLMLFDLPDADNTWLNREDVDSPARSFLYMMLQQYPHIPILLLNADGYTDEERDSYLRRGVRGFISDDPAESLAENINIVFQHNTLNELARSNKLLTYETAQQLSPDGSEARIVLFDFQKKTAVKADDSDNILSMLSMPDLHFTDVIGADDAKAELQYFISFLKDPGKFTRKGAGTPKGVLLYGPPGTGKTMLAKAFAAESGAAFIAVEGNQFFKGYVGQGAAMVHRLFAAARRYAPSVLFVDEIDTIARARTGRDTDMAQDSEQILTAFFAEMDGFATDPSKPVFVLGATNYNVDGEQMTLDPAMLRRFDRRLLIDLPTAENRKAFLRKQIAAKPYFRVSEAEINSIGDRSAGMSLAQLTSVLELALRNGLRSEAECADDQMLEEAFESFSAGEKRTWSEDVVLRTARHEAGHALLCWLGGETPSYLTIVSRSNYGGYMQHAHNEERMGYTKPELLTRIRTALGGRAAEIVYYGPEEGISTGASGDLQSATRMAQAMLCTYGMDDGFGMAVVAGSGDTEVRQALNRILNEQLQQAIEQITEHRDAMDRLVDALIKSNSLKSEDIDRLLSDMV